MTQAVEYFVLSVHLGIKLRHVIELADIAPIVVCLS